MALTERQEQIKSLLKAGKTAEQIGDQLGVTANAVYQQIRRMRKAGETVGTRRSGGRASTAKKGGRQSGRKRPTLEAAAATPGPRVAPDPAPARPATPLQSVRNRRAEIHADIRLAETEVTAAQRALDTAKAAHAKLKDRHGVELKSLDAAEKALAPKAAAKPAATKPATPRKRASRARSGAKGSTTAPAPAAAPQTPPQASENGSGDVGQVAPTPEAATA